MQCTVFSASLLKVTGSWKSLFVLSLKHSKTKLAAMASRPDMVDRQTSVNTWCVCSVSVMAWSGWNSSYLLSSGFCRVMRGKMFFIGSCQTPYTSSGRSDSTSSRCCGLFCHFDFICDFVSSRAKFLAAALPNETKWNRWKCFWPSVSVHACPLYFLFSEWFWLG